MNCTESLRTQTLLDGELTGAAAQEAERHMADCAQCQALAAEIADVSDALRAASRHRAPHALRQNIHDALVRETTRRPNRSFWTGVASGGGGMALAAGLAFFALLPPSPETLAAQVVEAHGRALTSGHTIMVVSTDHHTVKPWLSAHSAISPPVTDFAAEGFALTGGRLDSVADLPAAVMVYRHGKHEIDLFAWADHGARLPGDGMIHGFRLAFWKTGDLDFAAVSDTDSAAFEKFCALARAERE